LEALSEGAAKLAQQLRLLFGLDPFGDGLEVEGLTNLGNCRNDRIAMVSSTCSAFECDHEAAIDLEEIDRQLLEVRE
jgi:hypothetical protein